MEQKENTTTTNYIIVKKNQSCVNKSHSAKVLHAVQRRPIGYHEQK